MEDSNDWTALTEELSKMPQLWRKLLDQHRPDPHDRCKACTTPGTGTPQARWPCSLWQLADAARSTHTARRLRGKP